VCVSCVDRAGFFIFALGNILNFTGFMFAAQSLCSALGSIQFVTNLIFATLINHEVVTKVRARFHAVDRDAVRATLFSSSNSCACVVDSETSEPRRSS